MENEAVAQLVQAQVAQALQGAQAVIQQLQGDIQQLQQQQQQAPAPAPIAAARLKPSKPDNFRGDSRHPVTNFIFSLEQYFHLLQVTGDADKIHYAASLLKDSAATWWRSLHTQPNAVPTTWADFTAAIQDQFVTVNAEKTARDKLAYCRQKTSVRDYTFRFKQLLLDIPTMSAADQVDRYLRGLKFAVRKDVELRDPHTLDEATAAAERFDAISYRVSRLTYQRYPGPPRSYAQAVARPTPMELGMAAQQRMPMRPLLPHPRPAGGRNAVVGDRATATRTGACFYCKQQGHKMVDCPKRRESNRTVPALQQRRRSNY